MKLFTWPLLVSMILSMTACISDTKNGGQDEITLPASVTTVVETTETTPTVIEAPNETTSEPSTPPTENTPAITLPSTEPAVDASSTEDSPAAQVEILPWLRVPMHYEVLLGQPHLWNETGGVSGFWLARAATAGSTSMVLNSSDSLIPQQLIAYRGVDGEFYSAQIQRIEDKTLHLSTPLKQTVSAGANAWNFYSNGSHPNAQGYKVIADFAVRLFGKDRLNEGVHVLLGDSWFGEGSIHQRLTESLPSASLVNQGVGGNTSGELLARFDEAVLPSNPNFVWILTGTNDYWQDVSADSYQSNIATLIAKIKAAGAVPIVFDSSVGPLNFGSDNITLLSKAYVTALEQLLASSR